MTGFETIRKRAARRKGGDDVLKRLLGSPADNKTVARLTDDRILSTMAERVFSAGFVWRVIQQKWPGFEEAFLGFAFPASMAVSASSSPNGLPTTRSG